MPRTTKNQASDTPKLELTVTKDIAAAKIDDRINKGKELLIQEVISWEDLNTSKSQYYKWSQYNVDLLKTLFTNDTIANQYKGISISGGSSDNIYAEIDEFNEDIQSEIGRLESVKERLELYSLALGVESSAGSKDSKSNNIPNNKVFIVHGHDDLARESLARFLEKLSLEAIILNEQASGNLTIIEKLERYSNVRFAVVLLTPDDLGNVASSKEDLKPRARQNVVLELGYFMGKLGRENVCALHKGKVELPSDVLGIVYVPMDDNYWRVALAKELKEAGFDIDLNTAF